MSQDIITNIIIFLLVTIVLPAISSLCAYLYRRQLQKLPENQRLALEQFAQLAVQSIEQQNKMLNGEAKKSLALDAMKDLYQDHPQMREPSTKVMEIALEAAVLWLPRSREKHAAS